VAASHHRSPTPIDTSAHASPAPQPRVRLDAAQEERLWAIVSAHQVGLAIRWIAAATGLSATRVHQLLIAGTAEGIPAWLNRRPGLGEPAGAADEGASPAPDTALREHLAEEVAALRRCLGWLE